MLSVCFFLLTSALAQDDADDDDQPDDFSDVVLVWPDKLARWKGTRWLVATELVLPTGLGLLSRNNKGINTHAFQVRAIVACDQDYKLGRRKIEVSCKIEDFMIKAATFRRKTEKGRAVVQGVLDEVDAEMTGAIVQLQVNDRGSVVNIDLEGIPARNLRERQRLEGFRQIAARLFYPFHMKLPKSGVKEGNWPEFDSELMSMPSLNGITGFSTIVHWMNFYKGYLLVQDIGTGVVTVTMPPQSYDEPTASAADRSSSETRQTPGLGGGGGNAPPSLSRFESQAEEEVIPLAAFSYRLSMTGVSIYNVDNGIMEERVWSMTGTPTATNQTVLSYWYSGRIQLLGTHDNPDLGVTQQVGYPRQDPKGLPRWLPVDPEIEKDLKEMMSGGGGPKAQRH